MTTDRGLGEDGFGFQGTSAPLGYKAKPMTTDDDRNKTNEFYHPGREPSTRTDAERLADCREMLEAANISEFKCRQELAELRAAIKTLATSLGRDPDGWPPSDAVDAALGRIGTLEQEKSELRAELKMTNQGYGQCYDAVLSLAGVKDDPETTGKFGWQPAVEIVKGELSTLRDKLAAAEAKLAQIRTFANAWAGCERIEELFKLWEEPKP